MSSSIVLALQLFGVLRAGEVVVIAVGSGLFLAMAVALRRPVRRPHLVVAAEAESLGQGPRALTGLLSSWSRTMRAGRAAPEPVAAEPRAAGGDGPAGVPVIGYATLSGRALEEFDDELAGQAEVIARACEQRGLVLIEVVRERHTEQGLVRAGVSDGRPGLRYALGRIAAGEARGLVVPGLRRLTRSAAELGPIVDWFTRRGARLVAVAQGLDTAEQEGRVAARLIIEVSRWERER
jgi:Resolvase, N terminal domain